MVAFSLRLKFVIQKWELLLRFDKIKLNNILNTQQNNKVNLKLIVGDN